MNLSSKHEYKHMSILSLFVYYDLYVSISQWSLMPKAWRTRPLEPSLARNWHPAFARFGWGWVCAREELGWTKTRKLLRGRGWRATNLYSNLHWTKALIKLRYLKQLGPSRPLFLHFVFSIHLVVYIKICRLLDLNRGPVVSAGTALPAVPKPLPKLWFFPTFLCLYLLLAGEANWT